MTPERGVFSAKLSELESAYARLDSCVRHLQSADAAELKNQLKELDEEDRRCSATLEKRAGSRLPFAAALSSLQLKYVRGVDDLLSSEMDSGISRSDSRAHDRFGHGGLPPGSQGGHCRSALAARKREQKASEGK